jgi:hypothetical protein
VEWLGEIGITASNNPDASWQEVVDAAGYQPMVIGGRNWCHWVAVRMGGPAAGVSNTTHILLMNSSPGYREVGQYLWMGDFEALGPFSAVWFEGW